MMAVCSAFRRESALDDDPYQAVPIAVLLTGISRLVIHQLRDSPKTAQNEIPIIVVLLAVSAYMPAHAGVDQCVWGDYELVMRDGFAFVRTTDSNDVREELVRTIQGVLLVLFRGVMELGFTMDVLLKDSAGLSNLHIEEIGKAQDKIEVLMACGMKTGTLLEHVRKLELRSIAYRNGEGSLVLSESGAAFFNDLLNAGDLDV